MEKQELTEVCKDCGNEFTITVSEQNFYESKGLSLPKRCAECRAKRKRTSEERHEAVEEKRMSLEEMMKAAGIS